MDVLTVDDQVCERYIANLGVSKRSETQYVGIRYDTVIGVDQKLAIDFEYVYAVRIGKIHVLQLGIVCIDHQIVCPDGANVLHILHETVVQFHFGVPEME